MDSSLHINPRSIKPIGNFILDQQSIKLTINRSTSLGNLSILSDDLLLSIFSELSPSDLYRLQGVSKYFFAWSAGLDGLWKTGLIVKCEGKLSDWRKSWRSTYIFKFIIPSSTVQQLSLPTDSIKTDQVYSDVLFQPILCVNHSIRSIIDPLTPSTRLHSTVKKVNLKDLDEPNKLPQRPTILKSLIDNWPAYESSSAHRWSLDSLSDRYPNLSFRAESTLITLPDYRRYHDSCWLDESPVYLFDSQFVENTTSGPHQRGLGQDFWVPEIFQQDLFSCLAEQRPDYRWLIIGPARSGSTWHIDPNGTSAWNAVITGRKYWICFPPHVTPPGVIVNEDESEVESPLSISEWFLNYYQFAKKIYGPFSKHPDTRGLMLEGICEAGETFFVPSGWWHLVINLEPSIAITQNFVSENELSSVLHFMKYKPDQLSGFKFNDPKANCEEESEALNALKSSVDRADSASLLIFETFVDRLRRSQKIPNQSIIESLKAAELLESQRSQKRSSGKQVGKGQGRKVKQDDDEQDQLDGRKITKRRKQTDEKAHSSDGRSCSIWNQIRKSTLAAASDSVLDQPSQITNDNHFPQLLFNQLDHRNDASDRHDPGGFKFGFEVE